MEQHPIPQDITGFKFKLVGDMTLQQFGYLAVGSILAYLSFTSRFPFLIKWPLVFLFGFGGFALAFLPVEERPLDRWLISFIKAIYSPTQYLWQKKETLPDFLTFSCLSSEKTPEVLISLYDGSRAGLEEYLKSVPKTITSALDLAEQSFLQNINQLSGDKILIAGLTKTAVSPRLTTAAAMPPPKAKPAEEIKPQEKKSDENLVVTPPARPFFTIIGGKIIKREPPKQTLPLPAHKLVKPPVRQGQAPSDILGKLQYQNLALTRQADTLKEQLGKIKHGSVFTVEDLNKLKELAQRLSEVEKQKHNAQEELLKLKQRLEEERTAGIRPIIEEVQIKQTPRVRFIPGQQAKHAGLPSPPQTPNIISGLVTDQKGEILPGVIVVVKDIYDNPVRAMKTIKVGQFSISTPLPDGIYNLELEKEGYSFDIIEIEAKKEIIPPVEIKAK